MLNEFVSNDVQTFRDAFKKFGAKRYAGLTIGNEVSSSVRIAMKNLIRC
jgi:putative flippase GtrA